MHRFPIFSAIDDKSLVCPALITAGLFVAVTAGSAASAGTMLTTSYDPYHQALANDEAFSSVGQFQGSTGTSSYTGSGVYLGDGWILTAAHVVDQAAELSFEIAGQSYAAESWAYHADWNPADVIAGNDLALVKLTEDVSDPSVSAATLYTGTDETGQLGVTVGYGLTGTGFAGYDLSQPADTKRAGTNIVDGVYGDDVLLSDFDSGWFFHNSTGSSQRTELEYLIAPGDSGGGLFLYDEELADWTLAGINSFGYGLDGNPDSDFGDVSGQVRVSSHTDWIDATMNAEYWSSGVTDSLDVVYSDAVFFSPVTTLPEPIAASVVGLSLFCLRRRKAA
ncbi:MAG: trypsin-like serine protease [Planctomycetota bacterium]